MVSSLVELDQQYGDQLVIIGIDDGESPDVVRTFANEQGITYLNLIGDAKTFRAYRLRAHPYTVLITAEGQGSAPTEVTPRKKPLSATFAFYWD